MALRRRLKLKDIFSHSHSNDITGYGARIDPICNVCGHNKPLNWWVKICADITCCGRYKAARKRLILK